MAIASFTPPQPIESPCVNICRIDQNSGWCAGCARSLHEIGRWTSGTAAWRAEVMADIPSRKLRMIART